MVFTLNEEQQDFERVLKRFFENECSSEYVRKRIEHPSANDITFSKKLHGLGLTQILADRGTALDSLRELSLFAIESGRGLCPEYVLENLIYGPLLFSSFISNETRTYLENKLSPSFFQDVISGTTNIIPVPSGIGKSDSFSLTRKNGVTTASGTLRLVPYQPDSFLCLRDPQGEYYLFSSPVKENPQIKITPEHALDITRMRVQIELVELELIPLEIADKPLFNSIQACMIACEILGAVSRAIQMTVEHVKTRQQFGVPIGSFQAVQQPLADCYTKLELLNALSTFAVWTLKDSPFQRELASHAALRFAIRDSTAIIEKMIQLHGGIGFTWEHDLHLLLRRVRGVCALEREFGYSDQEFIGFVQS
jgi:hypothetical protein